jgi:mitochondrial inner membrane protease subunit 1
MLPLFPVRAHALVNPFLGVRGRGLKVGDVVTARSMREPGGGVIKRVVGMPGDYVDVRGGGGAKMMSVDGDVEDAVSSSSAEEGVEMERRRDGKTMVRVPDGHCWLAGENAPASIDSRHYGPVPLGLVLGRVEGIVWWEGWRLRWERIRNGMERM